MRITVGIATRLLESADDGRSWTEATREVPADDQPRVWGVGRDRLPAVPPGWTLTEVHVLPDGIGLAAGCEPTPEPAPNHRDTTARFFRTTDSGATWQPLHPDIGWWGRVRSLYGWPAEAVDSIGILPGGEMAFTWEDPWIFEGSQVHTVVSPDGGATWRYFRGLGGYVVAGPGPLRVCSGAFLAVWTDRGRFRREPARVEWRLPDGYLGEYGFWTRTPRFISEEEGCAITATWSRDRARPPLVGLARTRDGGHFWEVTDTWEGPMGTDINRRHMLTVDVQP